MQLNITQITLDFFPSSSILYSVTVFIFPLMVSLGDGSVPVKTIFREVTLRQTNHKRKKKKVGFSVKNTVGPL